MLITHANTVLIKMYKHLGKLCLLKSKFFNRNASSEQLLLDESKFLMKLTHD